MHYRETILWQKAMECAREIYRLAPRLPREETYGMGSQINAGCGVCTSKWR